MRLLTNSLESKETTLICEFSQWILNVGDGNIPTVKFHEDEKSTWIKIPDDLLIPYDPNPIESFASSIYDDFLTKI